MKTHQATDAEAKTFKAYQGEIVKASKHIPDWVKVVVAWRWAAAR